MNKNQYKFTGDDESYTYSNLILPLLELIEEWKRANNKSNVIIWCPFDMREKKVFKAGGCIGNQPSFKSIYFCKDFLINKQIKFIELEKESKDFKLNNYLK